MIRFIRFKGLQIVVNERLVCFVDNGKLVPMEEFKKKLDSFAYYVAIRSDIEEIMLYRNIHELYREAFIRVYDGSLEESHEPIDELLDELLG